MKIFYQLIANTFISVSTINMTWFALSLWVYTRTNSVVVTSVMSGIYMLAMTATGMYYGSLVDHHKKKTMMIFSSAVTLIAFSAAFLLYTLAPDQAFETSTSIYLWTFIVLIFAGVNVGNIRNITLPTVTSLLVPEENRDKANGLSGTITGISFVIASIVSGFFLASSGMYWILLGSLGLLVVAIAHLFSIDIPEKKIIHHSEDHEGHAQEKKFSPGQTFDVIKTIPGLFSLILFTSFNNFLGGVFMPLLDPYGLSLVSLQVWGAIWGFLSLGFMVGGIFIAKKGLGKNPLQTLFLVNMVLWIDCILFAIQPSIVLLSVGMFIYICLVPFVEASEQTVIQKIVPKGQQGRVFGFAQSIETSASPFTAFLVGPIAQFFFIPFMHEGGIGAKLIGPWFGIGDGRGIGLLFTLAGVAGLLMTLVAMRSSAFKLLSKNYTAA